MMDILERLRDPEYDWCNNNKKCNGPMFMEAADEIERLRDDKAELVEALIDMRNHINKRDWDENVSNEAKATFAKATGGE
jgi:hypothetical protein